MSAPRRPSERIFGLLTGVVLAIVIVLVLSPAILTVVLSFSNDPSISFPPKSWGVERYIQLFSDTVWLEPLWLSVRLSLASAALSVTLGLGVLIAVHRSRMPFRNVLEQASLIALILPVSAYAVAMYVVFVKFGLLGTAFGLILANTVIALPFVVLVGSVALRQLPGDFELVAFTLGASRARALVGVTLRMIVPALAAGFVMSFQAGFEEAVFVNFIGGPELKTLPKAISDSVRYGSDPVITAIAASIVLITTIGIAVPLALSRGAKK